MQFEAGISLSRGAAVTEGPSLSPSLNQDALWQMNLRTNEAMESGSLPERPGEPDCSYYIRTGLCRFGATCRFNHPPNRKLYYLKTGTCKFGATCKFHHPRDKAGIAGRVSLNVLGYPLRPNEIECAYYLRTGQCKFGSTCKFHHPQPNNMMVSLRGSPVYPTVQSPTTPSQQSYAGGITNWSRASFIPSPRWQGPSSYAPMLLPQGMGQLGSVSSSENLQQTSGNSQIYGASRQTEPSNSGSQGTMSPFRSGSIPVGFYALQRESVFPERPGQPECQFYMKTGDCKFGAVCRFHHPRERLLPVPDCVLSPIGLPLRPGEPLCIFYSRYGICKFGPSCKFDHPMGIFTYNLSASSSADAPVRRFLGSSSATGALNLSSEGLVEAGSGRRLSLPETRQMSSGDDEIDTEG
ncbi:zinc finger CCCH domain-containing protein 63 [Citrus sinensis]|nr:zinc finger CCCH domain-containing protein 63 [Citrus sinensis]